MIRVIERTGALLIIVALVVIFWVGVQMCLAAGALLASDGVNSMTIILTAIALLIATAAALGITFVYNVEFAS